MGNSSRPIRGLLIAFAVAALICGGIMYTYSQLTGAPDDVPLTGADLPDPSQQ